MTSQVLIKALKRTARFSDLPTRATLDLLIQFIYEEEAKAEIEEERQHYKILREIDPHGQG